MNSQTPAKRQSALVFNWIFIAGVLLLALNDHYFKWDFGNWFTGKLSNFVGLLIFPMFLLFLFPRLSGASVWLTGLFFIYWKSPFSGGLIGIYNHFAFIPITRTVDYSDLIALAVLPLSYYLIKHIRRFSIDSTKAPSLGYLLVIPAAFIFIATEPPISYYMKPGGDIHIGKYYKMKVTSEQALSILKSKGFVVEPDTTQPKWYDVKYYVINNAVLDGGKDTLKAIQFGFFGTGERPLLLINNVVLTNHDKIHNLNTLRRYYKKLIQSDIVEEVR